MNHRVPRSTRKQLSDRGKSNEMRIWVALVLTIFQTTSPKTQLIESIVLLKTIGGDCREDIDLVRGDLCLERG